MGGIKHTYTLDGAKILREQWVEGEDIKREITPLYDNEDNVCGILHCDIPYYFLKNLQGDVIAITNQRGETVARYTYDAWGACTISYDATATPTVEGGEAINIATVNPFRYRSYYFDAETGLYYLQSRYYDPVLGRFINGDSPAFLGMDGPGFNLFGYCGNSLPHRSDTTGFAFFMSSLPLLPYRHISNTITFAAKLYQTYSEVRQKYSALVYGNYEYNQGSEKHSREVTDYVYGQYYVDMKFASSTVAEQGCGIVAAHNALKALGKGQKLSELVFYFDKKNGHAGDVWAAPYWNVAGCIKEYGGVKTKTTLFPKQFDEAIKKSNNKMGIVAYKWHYFFTKWNSRRSLFTTFNRYSDDKTAKTCKSIDKILKNEEPLCLITF